VDHDGRQFLGWTDLSDWHRSGGVTEAKQVLESPVIPTAVRWDELVASWNADAPPGTAVRIEVQPVHYPGTDARYYCLGQWSVDNRRVARESVAGQKDVDGEVATDTLVLKRPAKAFRVRLTLTGHPEVRQPRLEFFGVSVVERGKGPGNYAPERAAWGRVLRVPIRSQVDYPEGVNAWCSPTSVSMVLAYWAAEEKRPDWDWPVPAVAAGVYDRTWVGTGNWSFNVAFAGSIPGIRAYAVRWADVAEIEAWVARGVPVVASVCYDLLRGRPSTGESGHLVVCVGFTDCGDVILNDPGTRQVPRRTVSRADFIRAWATSRNTVYVIHPETWKTPANRRRHWHG